MSSQLRILEFLNRDTGQWESAQVEDVGNINDLNERFDEESRKNVVSALNYLNERNRIIVNEIDRDLQDVIDELLNMAEEAIRDKQELFDEANRRLEEESQAIRDRLALLASEVAQRFDKDFELLNSLVNEVDGIGPIVEEALRRSTQARDNASIALDSARDAVLSAAASHEKMLEAYNDVQGAIVTIKSEEGRLLGQINDFRSEVSEAHHRVEQTAYAQITNIQSATGEQILRIEQTAAGQITTFTDLYNDLTGSMEVSATGIRNRFEDLYNNKSSEFITTAGGHFARFESGGDIFESIQTASLVTIKMEDAYGNINTAIATAQQNIQQMQDAYGNVSQIMQNANQILAEMRHLSHDTNGRVNLIQTELELMQGSFQVMNRVMTGVPVSGDSDDPIYEAVRVMESRISSTVSEINLEVTRRERDSALGMNQWIVNRFDQTFPTATHIPSIRDTLVPYEEPTDSEEFLGMRMTRGQDMQLDATIISNLFGPSHRLVRLFTNINTPSASAVNRNFSIVLTGNNISCRVVLNGASIFGAENIGANRSVQISPVQGWNRLEILLYNHDGNTSLNLQFGQLLQNQVEMMTANIGMGNSESSAMIEATAGIRVLEDNITLAVRRISENEEYTRAMSAALDIGTSWIDMYIEDEIAVNANERVQQRMSSLNMAIDRISLNVTNNRFDELNQILEDESAGIEIDRTGIGLFADRLKKMGQEIEEATAYLGLAPGEIRLGTRISTEIQDAVNHNNQNFMPNFIRTQVSNLIVSAENGLDFSQSHFMFDGQRQTISNAMATLRVSVDAIDIGISRDELDGNNNFVRTFRNGISITEHDVQVLASQHSWANGWQTRSHARMILTVDGSFRIESRRVEGGNNVDINSPVLTGRDTPVGNGINLVSLTRSFRGVINNSNVLTDTSNLFRRTTHEISINVEEVNRRQPFVFSVWNGTSTDIENPGRVVFLNSTRNSVVGSTVLPALTNTVREHQIIIETPASARFVRAEFMTGPNAANAEDHNLQYMLERGSRPTPEWQPSPYDLEDSRRSFQGSIGRLEAARTEADTIISQIRGMTHLTPQDRTILRARIEEIRVQHSEYLFKVSRFDVDLGQYTFAFNRLNNLITPLVVNRGGEDVEIIGIELAASPVGSGLMPSNDLIRGYEAIEISFHQYFNERDRLLNRIDSAIERSAGSGNQNIMVNGDFTFMDYPDIRTIPTHRNWIIGNPSANLTNFVSRIHPTETLNGFPIVEARGDGTLDVNVTRRSIISNPNDLHIPIPENTALVFTGWMFIYGSNTSTSTFTTNASFRLDFKETIGGSGIHLNIGITTAMFSGSSGARTRLFAQDGNPITDPSEVRDRWVRFEVDFNRDSVAPRRRFFSGINVIMHESTDTRLHFKFSQLMLIPTNERVVPRQWTPSTRDIDMRAEQESSPLNLIVNSAFIYPMDEDVYLELHDSSFMEKPVARFDERLSERVSRTIHNFSQISIGNGLFTFSGWIRPRNETTTNIRRISIVTSDEYGNNQHETSMDFNSFANGTWRYFEFTSVPSAVNGDNRTVFHSIRITTDIETLTDFAMFKLVRGARSSREWHPSPEDYSFAIDHAREDIERELNVTISNVQTRLDTAEGLISNTIQQADLSQIVEGLQSDSEERLAQIEYALRQEIEGRLSDENARLLETVNRRMSSLDQKTSNITASFKQAGGANLLRNSIGIFWPTAGVVNDRQGVRDASRFWTTAQQADRGLSAANISVQNMNDDTPGFSHAFTFRNTPNEIATAEDHISVTQVFETQVGEEYTVSFSYRKPQSETRLDFAINTEAGGGRSGIGEGFRRRYPVGSSNQELRNASFSFVATLSHHSFTIFNGVPSGSDANSAPTQVTNIRITKGLPGNIVFNSLTNETQAGYIRYNPNTSYFVPQDSANRTTGWLPCVPGRQYTLSGAANRTRVLFRNMNGEIFTNFIGTNPNTQDEIPPFTAPEDAYEMMVYYRYGITEVLENQPIMILEGTETSVPSWSNHPEETLATNIRMDIGGITVHHPSEGTDAQANTGHRTIMTSREFAGYDSSNQRLFAANSDHFYMREAKIGTGGNSFTIVQRGNNLDFM